MPGECADQVATSTVRSPEEGRGPNGDVALEFWHHTFQSVGYRGNGGRWSPPRPNTQSAQGHVAGQLAAQKPPLPSPVVDTRTRRAMQTVKRGGTWWCSGRGWGLTGRKRGDTLGVLVVVKVLGALGIRAERDRGETGSENEAEHG